MTGMEAKMGHKKINAIAVIELFAACGTVVYYKLLWDIGILLLLFLSAYCCGQILCRHAEDRFVKFAVGLGCIGIVLNLFLLVGIYTNGWMCLILMVPILIQRTKLAEDLKAITSKALVYILHVPWWSVILVIGLIFLIIMGSAPIDAREGDALAKHLPITVYAANNGKWYRNLSEGLVYGESMLLVYTYWTAFYSVHAYKAMTLFNVALFIITFFMACKIAENVYERSSRMLLGIVYFSAPLFFDLATMMGTDMVSVFYFTAAFMIISKMDLQEIWKKTYLIAYLCACSLFSKLTVINGIFVIVGIVMIFDSSYALKHHKISKLLGKVVLSGMLWCVILLPNVAVYWLELGNPFLPAYNGLFRSQYYLLENFHDIYDNAPFRFSLDTVWNLVFETDRNRIEGLGRDLGLFPFGVFLIPVAAWINKKKKFTAFCSIPFISMVVGCIFTYNLRYLSSAFLLFMIAVVCSVSVILEMISHKLLKKSLYYSIAFVLFSFNLFTFSSLGYYIKQGLKVNASTADFFMENILNEIPAGKKVFMVDSIAFKSDYKGYFVSNNWYISYILEKINDGLLSWEQYLNCFDYVLDSKEFVNQDADIENIIKDAGSAGALLELYAVDGQITCYKVNHSCSYQMRTVCGRTDIDEEIVVEHIENLNEGDGHLIVNWETGLLEQDAVIEVRMEWLDQENHVIGCQRQYHSIYADRKQYESLVFDRDKDAVSANLVLETSPQSKHVKCSFQKLEVSSYEDFIWEESKKLGY